MTKAVELAQVASTGVSEAFKNRIINGAMTFSQRNGTSTVAAPADGTYVLDRYRTFTNGGGVYSVAQSSVAPAGFVNSMLCTVTTNDSSIAAGDYYLLVQAIEGYNIADLGWGTANAQTVTTSFWVRSSVTGTYAFSLRQGSGARSYIATYTISAANTWEYKTITIAGDTSGTWDTTNGGGILVSFDLGSGSNYQGTANTWQANNTFATSASTKLISTNGATFYLTGLQLEVGTSATNFEYRPYGTELVLCQRYCEVIVAQGNNAGCWPIQNGSSTNARGVYAYKVQKRAAPTFTNVAGTNWIIQNGNGNFGPSAVNVAAASPSAALIDATTGGITAGQASILLEGSVSAGTNMCIFSAEL